MWLSRGCADDCVAGMLRFGNANESSVSPSGLVCCCVLGCGGGIRENGADGRKSRLLEKPYFRLTE